MEDLPQIEVVDSTAKFFNVVCEENETSRKNKVLAYLNQNSFINCNVNKQCLNGHATSLKKSKKLTDGTGVVLPKNVKKLKVSEPALFF